MWDVSWHIHLERIWDIFQVRRTVSAKPSRTLLCLVQAQTSGEEVWEIRWEIWGGASVGKSFPTCLFLTAEVPTMLLDTLLGHSQWELQMEGEAASRVGLYILEIGDGPGRGVLLGNLTCLLSWGSKKLGTFTKRNKTYGGGENIRRWWLSEDRIDPESVCLV